MAKKYTKQELWDVYEKLPEDLQEAVFAPETAEHINKACERIELEEKVPQVAKFTGRVLMGLLTPKEFKKRLSEDVDLSKEQVKPVYREINRFIFMPVLETLSALYGVEIEPTKKPRGLEGKEKTEGEEKGPSEDKYREPIE